MINPTKLTKLTKLKNVLEGIPKNLESWKETFQEIKQSVIDYKNRDRSKDKKMASRDLTNPSLTSQEIAMYDYN